MLTALGYPHPSFPAGAIGLLSRQSRIVALTLHYISVAEDCELDVVQHMRQTC